MPGEDSQSAGWMTPSSAMSVLSNSINGVASQVLPPSELLSMKAFQTLFFSLDAGASQVPSDNTMLWLRTGPLPPLSPGTNSTGAVHVFPLSSEVCTHVSQ